jgi:hypothetical protein
MRAKLRAAFGATLFALAIGAVVAGILSTIRLLLVAERGRNPSLMDLLMEPLLVFSTALVSSAIGALLYLLAPGYLLFAAYAIRSGGRRLTPGGTALYAIAFTLILLVPMSYVGYRPGTAEGLPLTAALVVGLWAGLRRLDGRLSGQQPAIRRFPKALLFAAAGALTLIALWGSILIIDWLRHPGGLGLEQLVVPPVGLVVLLCVYSAVALVRRAFRQRPAVAPDAAQNKSD